MQAYNLLSNTYEFFQSILAVGSVKIANHFLQAYFFSAALTNLVSFILNIINFAYANVVAESKIIKIMAICMLFYLKIWQEFEGAVYITSIFSMTIVSLYVYDCCGSISSYLDNWRLNHRDWAIIGSFSIMFITTAYLFYSIHKNSQNALKYQYSGIYLLMVMIVIVGNMLRGRSVLYTLMGIFTMNYLIGSRYLLQEYLTNDLLGIAALPYFMMALQAEKKEWEQVQSKRLSYFFATSTSLAAFSILNDSTFPLEIVLGSVFIFGLIINR